MRSAAMAERAIKNRFALLQSTTASSVIEGVRPHVSCATYDIRQLADEIASLFAAKGSMIEEGDVTLTDVSGLLDEIAEFEKESMGFCADVRQAIRKLMAGRAISEVQSYSRSSFIDQELTWRLCRLSVVQKLYSRIVHHVSHKSEMAKISYRQFLDSSAKDESMKF